MTKKTLKIVAAVSAAGALAIGLGAVSSWYTNWNTSTWFGRGNVSSAVVDPDEPVEPSEPKNIAYDENGNDIADGDALPKQMTFYRSSAEVTAENDSERAALTLYATVTPSDAGIKNVEWRVKYVDATDEYIEQYPVSEYVTASNENSLSSTIECLQPFGSQIVVEVEVTDVFDNSVTAECTLDYLSVPDRISALTYVTDAYGDSTVLHTFTLEHTANGGAVSDVLVMFPDSTSYYRYMLRSIVWDWTVGTVKNDSTVNLANTYVTYSTSYGVGEKSYSYMLSSDRNKELKFYDYIHNQSGAESEILKASIQREVHINVLFRVPSGKGSYTYNVRFRCNFNIPVSSVSIDTTEYTFE